ncbi:MAG: ImmA/IrrE family metallo-endopeptidase [Endomicrobium sp.]|jgi:Zn-dependent peptidase ImmA (M78 family)|nr:ImmA/IrrE family metallo-endopeptidase [Endomicrobium sp.]
MPKKNKVQLDVALKACINPNVLKWARDSIGLYPSDVIKKLGRKTITEENLIDWEKGRDYPTVHIAKILAKMYGIKFIALYLQDIPKNIKPLKDFRVSNPNFFSRNFVFLMREIQGKQEWLKEYLTSKGTKPLNFVNSIGLNDGVKKAVQSINDLLLSENRLKPKAEESLKFLVEKIESLGIFVSIGNSFNGHYLYAVESSEARGFAIADKIAPFIFINSKDSKKAQLFTLIHEFCHLLLGESGVSDVSNRNNKPTEVFCNKATAEFLMPADKFMEVWNDATTDGLNERIKKLKDTFPASTLSIIIKIYELKLIDKAIFDKEYRNCKNDYAKFVSTGTQKQNKTFFANPYIRTLKINGRQFIGIVKEACNRNEIMIRNACSLLGIAKVMKFDTYERKWDKYL